jgi:hypothetical protein
MEGGAGILGLNPDWLKYGALGLLAISILVVGAITFQGAKNKAQFRLALVFMAFTLIVAALAIGSEIFRENSTVTKLTADLADATKKAADATAAQQAAQAAQAAAEKALTDLQVASDKALADLKSQAANVSATVTGEVGKIANALDAKWCAEVAQIDDEFIKRNFALLIGQMRHSLAAIQTSTGAQPPPIPSECGLS